MFKRITALALALVLCLCAAPISEAADTNPFEDVYATSAYYDAVMWALANGVTTGTDATHFQPFGHCTRGQVVTFLWRALGKAEPCYDYNPFEDVAVSDYFYKPVLWAVDNDITTGTDATHFSPDDPCTCAQILTFLWRALGTPDEPVAGTRAEQYASDTYYRKAVAWADRNHLLDSIFAPDAIAWRQQIIMYMHRELDESVKVTYVRKAPSFTAYFGNLVGSWDHREYDEFDVWEAKFESTYDVNCRMIENFGALVEKHGFNLTVQNQTENSDAEHDYRAIWYTYDGPEANKVQPTSKGGKSHFSIFYTNNFGYEDPNRNYLEIRCCIGKGLEMLDTGERATYRLTPWTEKFVPIAKTIPDPFSYLGVTVDDVRVNSKGERTIRLDSSGGTYTFLFREYVKLLESSGFTTRCDEVSYSNRSLLGSYVYSATSNDLSVSDVGKVMDKDSDFYISMKSYYATVSEDGYTVICVGVSPDLTYEECDVKQTRFDIVGCLQNKNGDYVSGLNITIPVREYTTPASPEGTNADANENGNNNADIGNDAGANAGVGDGLGAGDNNNAAAAVDAGLNFTPYKCPVCAGKTYISCSTCNGTGKREVWNGIKRQMETKTCDGGCNGTGRYSCGECKGDGIVEPADKDPNNPPRTRCGYCIGTGMLPCATCNGEGVKAGYDPFLKRTTVETCRYCYGRGGFDCPACKGDGWIDPGDPN